MKAINEKTCREWRELGFFYDFDSATSTWRLVGSESGLQRFAALLREYISNPHHHNLSEHKHYGPYMYLEIGTWTAPQVNSHWIAGAISDLGRLADLVDNALASARPGAVIQIGRKYAPSAEADIVLEVREKDFDPASADPACRESSA